LTVSAVGVGFFVDYNLQRRELSRFGLEVAISHRNTAYHSSSAIGT
jgi:hypothetical protein